MSFLDSTDDDSIRRVTDDYARHRLTVGSHGTASSIDHLWDLHPHSLSEAGLSRHSDSSAVLTEDTDSFIIGERVWVGGTKPGHIAFIGETQFAPGDWAGIALDEPIGKNDGSVGGIHYFQCEPKKGVFARLTRLTRVPLTDDSHMGSSDTFTFSNGVRKSPVSPTGSHRSLLKSPVSISGSNISLSSTSPHHVDFRVGDRVIIKSSQGSKVGTVRFMGPTEFANGEWVGVELDEPRGKNDGSVNGKRYFDCQPNFGLFAPISKVSKSPSKVKPGNCVIHSGTGAGLPPSGIMRRTNSKESMMSNLSMTSAASNARRVRLGVTSLNTPPKKVASKTSTPPMPGRTALQGLQDVLKEKQQHIEQLLKERDLERAEVTRAASQAEAAEQKLTNLTEEYDKYRAECEVKLEEHLTLLNKLKEDRTELVTQLEDERRKNEDWEFKFEEAAITKGDIEDVLKEKQQHIEQLLLKEQDLEREEGIKAAGQADADKQKLTNLTQEYDKYRAECEVKLQDHLTLLNKLKEDKTELVLQLEDERRKNEDWESKFKEAAITKGDIEGGLKEKQQFIEQLLKERDLERAEITTSASQAKAADQKLTDLTQEYDKYRGECEVKLQEYLTLLTKLKEDRAEFVTQLEDERRKNEHWESKFQEAAITKGDIENVLKERQQHIEQLLKERDLERAEVTRSAASQADAVDQKLTNLNQEYDKYRTECEVKLQEHLTLLNKLKEDRTELVTQLEDERRKNEDWESKFKEAVIAKADIEEILKEKQQHTEKLLKERDIERVEFTKAASQAEAAEQKLTNLTQEYDKYRAECEVKLKEHLTLLNKLKEDRTELVTQFEDEKRKNEDWVSKFEEAAITRGDMEGKLKEKQEHIEQLLKERDLERAEVTTAANQADAAGQKLTNLTQEYEKYRSECDVKLQEHLTLLNKFKEDRTELVRQLEDGRRKNEEWHKKFEEAAITKGDIEDVLKEKQQHIEQLQKERDLERAEVTKAASQANAAEQKLTNLTQEYDKHRGECEVKLQEHLMLLNQLKEDRTELVTQLEDERRKNEDWKVKFEEAAITKRDIEDTNEVNVSRIKELVDLLTKEKEIVEVLKSESNKLVEAEESLMRARCEVDFLKKELESNNSEQVSRFNEKIEELEFVKQHLDAKTLELQNLDLQLKENKSQYESDLNLRSSEAEALQQCVNTRDEMIRSLEAEVKNLTTTLDKVTNDLLKYQSNLSDVENSLKKERDQIREELDLKNKEIQEVKQQLVEQISAREKKIEEVNQIIIGKTELANKYLNEISCLKTENEKCAVQIEEKFQLELAEKQKALNTLRVQLGEKESEVGELKTALKYKEDDNNNKVSDLEKFKSELESTKENNKHYKETIEKLNKSLEELEHSKKAILSEQEQSEKNLTELMTENEKLKGEIKSVLASSDDFGSQITQLQKEIAAKSTALEAAKSDCNKNVSKIIQEQYQKLQSDSNKQKAELETKLKIALEAEATLKKVIVDSEKGEQEIAELRKSLEEIKRQLNNKDKIVFERDQEILMLKNEIIKLRSSVNGAPPVNGEGDSAETKSQTDYKQLLEEKIFAENQVSFLNSIIVDMQKKNEEQKARIEILEMGYSPAAAEELKKMGFKTEFTREPAPRMYCDICEEFDLHETEDCPTQASDAPPISHAELGIEPRKQKPPQRPYCEICGVFGHEAEDCNDDQEF